MISNRFKFILFFFCLLVRISATDYYISDSGNNSNSGNISSPFKTIQHAASIMTAGDVCYIREGVYRETVRPAHSGTVDAPLKFVAYQNEQVVVSGLDIVSNWSVYSGDIYSANINAEVTQVFINGYLADWARYPNKTTNMLDLTDMANVTVNANHSGTIGASNFPANFFKNAYIVALCGSKWVSVMGKVSSSQNNAFDATNTSKYWSGYNPPVYLGSGIGYMIGNLNLLDAENEWFSENGKLYVCALGKVNPNDAMVEAQTRRIAFDLDGLSFIEIKGIHIKAATVNIHSSENCIVEDCSVRYPVPFFHFSEEFGRSSNPENWSGKGVILSGKNNIIRNTYIAHSWGDGISMWGENNRIENCIIEDCNWMAVDCAPVAVTGKNHIITNNTLRQAARCGLVHRHLETGKITFNDISLGGILCTDLGLTYTYATNGKNTEIAYNWIHDNWSKGPTSGIYLDNNDTAFVVHHNVVWNCKEGIRVNLPSVNNNIYNNTLWTVNNAMPNWGSNGTSLVNVNTWNNLSNKIDFSGNNKQNNLTVTKTCFFDVDNHDFSLAAGSPAIDKGKIIPGITDGFTGSAPDVGAYEFGKPVWQSGATISIPVFDDDIPAMALNLKAELVSNNNVSLQWDDNSTNESGFRIERSFENTNKYVMIASVPANVSSYSDTNALSPSSSYTYRICSFNNAGTSMYSNEVAVLTHSDGTKVRLEAEKYSEMSGIIVNDNTIGSCDNGDYVCFRGVTLTSEMKWFTAKLSVPAQYANQKVEIRLGGKNGALLGTLTTKSTGSWVDFEEQKIKISPTTGTYDIYFVFKGRQGVGNFDWFMFEIENASTGINETKTNECSLSQNYPNPFHDFTEIEVNMDKFYLNTYLSIYSIQGLEVNRTRISDVGKSIIKITSETLPPGIYFYNIVINNNRSESKKMVCVRNT